MRLSMRSCVAAAGRFRPESPKLRPAPIRIAFVCSLSLTLLTAAATNATAQALAIVCHGAQRPGQIAELLFGRDIGNHVGVSEAAWMRFVAREITPRFPDGLTITNAIGQWRDPASARVVREPSKRVEIALPGRADDESRLDAIVAAYKRRFHQHSVGVIVQSACISF
jgi:hypothetical protein